MFSLYDNNSYKFQITNTQLMQLIKGDEASTPILINVRKMQNTIPHSRYVTYYQIPIYPQKFKPIQEMKQILINSLRLKIKILDLQMVNAQPIFKQAYFQIKLNNNSNSQEASLQLKINEGDLVGSISLFGNVINKSNEEDIVFSMSVKEINGYSNFLAFRQKYRVLENITRKKQFKLDHHLSILDGNSETPSFKFPLTQQDRSHYFFTSRKLLLRIQQIYSVEDWQTTQILLQQTLDLANADSSIKAILNILQKLKITLQVQMIKNQNVSTCEMCCIRVLQFQTCSGIQNKKIEGGQILIGTDRVSELARVSPVLNNRFYDHQFGYINENLKNNEQDTVYNHISQLTKSFPTYPHLKNSKIIDINGSKFLKFQNSFKNNKLYDNEKQNTIQIPLVYILQGINVIQTETSILKFYIQFSKQHKYLIQQKNADKRRVYEMKLQQIWNLGEIMSSNNDIKQLKIKILTTDLNYTIPFTVNDVDVNSFRKQARNLQLSTQYSQFSQNKYFMLTQMQTDLQNKQPSSKQNVKMENVNKLKLVKTQQIAPFYVLDLFSSASVVFQVASSQQILMQGYVQRQRIIFAAQTDNKQLRVILSSTDNKYKIILIFSLQQIVQKNQSLHTYYRFFYKLEFTDDIPCDSVYYNLQIKRLTDNKRLKQKITPQIADDQISTLHYFEDGFYQNTLQDIQLQLNLRKMYYNQDNQFFDNQQVINKKIIVNCAPGQALVQGCLGLIIKQQGYNSIDFDFYDENIKKRLNFHLQVFMKKMPLLDIDSGRYVVKIPQYLWKINSLFMKNQMQLQLHTSTRRQKVQKSQIYPDSPQEYYFKLRNFKDGLSVTVIQSGREDKQIGYDRIINLCKAKCQIDTNKIVWMDDGSWYLCLVNVQQAVFYFLLKWQYSQLRNQDQDGQASDRSAKTAEKKGSERSYSQKIDKQAKTVRNFPLTKLKQHRNNLILQDRQMTTKYVQREETIINLTKKIADLEQKLTKRRQWHDQMTETSTNTSGKPRNQSQNFKKMKQLYRSICQCGQKNPKYNGYCQKCLKELRNKYQLFMKQYKQKSYEYERIQFNKFNTKQKYYKVKNKLLNYKQRLKAGKDIEDDNINDVIQQFENQDLKRKIQQAKINIFRLKQEKASLETSSKLRLNAIEGMIKAEDEQIWQMSNQMQKYSQELAALKQRISSQKKQE